MFARQTLPAIGAVDLEEAAARVGLTSHSSHSSRKDSPVVWLLKRPAMLLGVWLLSLVIVALLFSSPSRESAPQPPVMSPSLERDRLQLQSNTALWPNVCSSSSSASAPAEMVHGKPQMGAEGEAPFRYQLVAALIVKDEGAWLYSCLEYHLEVGVEHFFIVDDNSGDDTLAALQQYVDQGVVTLTTTRQLLEKRTDHTFTFGADGYLERQSEALNAALAWSRAPATRAEWLLVLDADEAFVAHHIPCLRAFFHSFPADTGVIYWHWQMFGTSGVERLADDEPMIGALTRKADVRYEENGLFKPAVRPDRIRRFPNPHFPESIPDAPWLHLFTDGSRAQIAFGPSLTTVSHAQLNHYFTRDADYYRRFKVPERQAIAHDSMDRLNNRLQDFNRTDDFSAVPFAPAVMRRVHARRRVYATRRP